MTKDWFTVISPYKPPTEHYKEISWCEEKFGEEHVDSTYSFEDCLDDWMVVNWAWEVKE